MDRFEKFSERLNSLILVLQCISACRQFDVSYKGNNESIDTVYSLTVSRYQTN
jgi:hypothetical protein